MTMPHNWIDWLALLQTVLSLPATLLTLRDIMREIKKHLPQQKGE